MPRKTPRGAVKAPASHAPAARFGACEATLVAAGLVSYASEPGSLHRQFYGDVESFFGCDLQTLSSTPWEEWVHPDDRSLLHPANLPGKPGEPYRLLYRLQLPGGRTLSVQDSGMLSADPASGEVRWAGILSDASRLQALEERLRYVHRMEAFGQMTGGVAHDFNNLLTLLRGYAELLQSELSENPAQSEYVHEMIRAADRAVSVTRQLQAFCRVQMPSPGIVHPGGSVMELSRMLRRMVGEEIEFVIDVAENSGSVLAAPSQIDAIVMQLVAHAREELAPGSRLGLSVCNATVRSNDRRVQNEGWTSGPYVVIGVESRPPRKRSSAPSSPAPEPRTFEGLSEAWELWSASGAQLEMESEPDGSQRIRAYLPRLRLDPVAEQSSSAPAPAPAAPTGRGETVLLVEDDPETLRLYSMGIERLGYIVLRASHGEEALRLAKAHPEIDLVLTDLVMPLMGGVELAGELKKSVLPAAPIILMSGYTPEGAGAEDERHAGYPFLSKPFSLKTLAHKLREFIENQ